MKFYSVMEKDTEFYKTYVYFIFAEDEFYPIGGGKGPPEFEERLEEIKKSLNEKNYKVTKNDIEVRKNTVIIWNCPCEDKLISFVGAIFKLLKKIDIPVDINLSLNIPPTSNVKNIESTIKSLWDVEKGIIIRSNTDAEINDKILTSYGDGESKIFGSDAEPRAVINLEQELYIQNLTTEKIQGAKYIQAFGDIRVNQNIQKVERLKTNNLRCGGMMFCGSYSEDDLIEGEILVKNLVCESSVEKSYVSFGSEKSDEIIKAQKELEIKKQEAINFFNDKAVLVRRQIIMDQKFGLAMKDKKWIKFIFEQAQKDYKRTSGKDSILDYVIDLIAQHDSNVFIGPITVVNGKKHRMKKEVASLKEEKEKILRTMDEFKVSMQNQEEEIAIYKEKIRKEYWGKKLYLETPFGEFWLEKLRAVFGKRENPRDKLRGLFEKFVGITTTMEIFDKCPDYNNFLTIYKSFLVIHKEMMKRLIELITKNKEYIEYLAGDAAKTKHPNFVTNSLNNSVIRLDYNDFVLINGLVSQSKIFGGTHNRIVILGDINSCDFECDDISIKGNIDPASKIVTKCLTAERCTRGVKISTGEGSRILFGDTEYLEEFEFTKDAQNVILSETPGRRNVYEITFS